MTDGLKDAHRTAIVDVLRANGCVERAVLFGSRATETFTPGSDADIALFGEALTTADQARLAMAMEELTVPQRVDLLLYDGIEDAALRKHVRRDGIELYRKQENASAGRLNVPERHRRTLVSLLREHLPGVEVWAYGRRVNGCGRDGSALDLVLRGPGLKEIPASRLADFEEALRESLIPFLVEARDWARLPERFHREITREHVVLMEGKESAVASDDWPKVTLGEFAPFSYGKGLRKDMRDPAGYIPVFGSNGHVGWHDKALTNGPTVIVGRKGTVGAVHYSPVPCWPIDTTFFISGDEEELVRFRYYALNTLGLGAMNADSAVPGLNREASHLRELRVPSLSEQRAIAHILGTLDDKIELNRRMNETLEATARAIFKDWFVDFGPVRARMEGRAPYLPPEIWGLFPDALDDAGKPMGWTNRRLEDFLELAYGKSLPSKKRMPGKVAVYGSGGLTGIHDTALIDGPAVIVGRKGTVGSLYWEDRSVFPIDTVFYVVPRIGSILFSYHLLAAQPLREMNTDAAVPGLNRGNAYRLEFSQPTSELISAFEDVTGVLWRRRSRNLMEVETLSQTRDLLLPKLISGDIRVRDAERLTGETV